ncbi:hypothetical protein B0T14DRAFT_429376 [Immersiella caudata]|uniref:Capsule polysaccharide biosynthesis protein n=1 Tax=Immersiella caudata TaxID=314043 RepID=A0AA40BZ05_9PEZI|nr:hypothetical protein B0T14DRAFT_429376 [Immersiella caudata]
MASAVGKFGTFFPVLAPAAAAGAVYGGHRILQSDWKVWLHRFVSGPGRTSRILLILFVILNWKSMPLGWTFRVFHSWIYHIVKPNKKLPQRALFHYAISSSRTSFLETDYNMHKSNSTYFADIDVSRSHLVTHILGSSVPKLNENAKYKLVLDKEGKVVKGGFGIGLGAVFCSFRKEIAPLQGYEMWTRVLSWDRKWLYIITHFVPKGKVRPTAWDGIKAGPTRSKVVRDADGQMVDEQDWSKYVFATAVSKYVFKVGRFTVHPAIAIEAAGLLPERPGEGWRGGESGTGTPEDLGEIDDSGEWDWRRVEHERRKGLELAQHFAALDGTNALFDGGEDGAVGNFPIG